MPNPPRYEICVRGWLDPCWFEWFQDLEITNRASGEAVLSGSLPDQAALHSVLTRIRDLNLVLISVQLIQEGGKQ